MATSDAISLCSQALILLGDDPIASFEGGSAGQVLAARRYQPIVDGLLAAHPWHFSRRVVRLARRSAAPPAATGYPAAYAMPPDCFRVVVPYVGDRPCDAWDILEADLLVEAVASDEVSLRYHGRVDESAWPPRFRQAVIYALAADWAMPLRESVQMAEKWAAAHETEMARLRHDNAVQRPGEPVAAVGRLGAVRRR